MRVTIERAQELLSQNQVVAIPTETVYGLAARMDSPRALEEVFRLKQRPLFDPLILHVAQPKDQKFWSLLQVEESWKPLISSLTERFWPGPLTLVLPKSERVGNLITAGLSTVAVRQPNHPLTLQLIEKMGVPLAAPSANLFGRLSPTKADHVEEEFLGLGVDLPVLDGGPCSVGVESTILQIHSPGELEILRSGMISPGDLIGHLQGSFKESFHFSGGIEGLNWDSKSFPGGPEKERPLRGPGGMPYHYMPRKPLIWMEIKGEIESIGEASIEYLEQINQTLQKMPPVLESGGVKVTLPPLPISSLVELVLNEDPFLAARELYHQLRLLGHSAGDGAVILFRYFPWSKHRDPLWGGVLERIFKASTLVIRDR